MGFCYSTVLSTVIYRMGRQKSQLLHRKSAKRPKLDPPSNTDTASESELFFETKPTAATQTEHLEQSTRSTQTVSEETKCCGVQRESFTEIIDEWASQQGEPTVMANFAK